jgi:hypothetical protein
MHIQIVMDLTGDTRHEFDPDDAASVGSAKARFGELALKGFRAVELGKDGEPGKLVTEFNREVEQVLFIPQLQGG